MDINCKNIDRFPGNLNEFNDLKGKEFVIMDTGKPEKYIRYSHSYKELSELIKQGCEGLIYFCFNTDGHLRFGMGVPVKRKEA